MYQIITAHHHITLSRAGVIVIILLVLWELVWKGVALWHAGRNKQLAWFVVMLILNTAGLLEIIYLLFFQKQPKAKTS